MKALLFNISVFSYKSSDNKPTFVSLYFSYFDSVPQINQIQYWKTFIYDS